MQPVAVDAPSLVPVGEPEEGPMAVPATRPRLSALQSAELGEYARRAGVAPGQPLFVVLCVLVGTDGTPGAITVVRSGGSKAADQAAVDYAHLLRWTPGTIDGTPRSMLVILPVTLDPSGQPSASLRPSSRLGGSRVPQPFWRQWQTHNTVSVERMVSTRRGLPAQPVEWTTRTWKALEER